MTVSQRLFLLVRVGSCPPHLHTILPDLVALFSADVFGRVGSKIMSLGSFRIARVLLCGGAGEFANDRLSTGPLRPLRWHLSPMTQLLCNIVSDLRRGFGIWAVGCCLLAKLPPLAHRSGLRCVLKMFEGKLLSTSTCLVHLSLKVVLCFLYTGLVIVIERSVAKRLLIFEVSNLFVVRLQFVVPKASRDGLVAC